MKTGQELLGRFVLDVFRPGSFEAFETYVRARDFTRGILCNLATTDGEESRVAVGITGEGTLGDERLRLICVQVEDYQPRIAELESRLKTHQQQNERLKDFIGIVVHDLANALQNVTAGISMLRMTLDPVVVADPRHKLERLRRATMSMHGILKGGMKYLRFEVGEYPMELTDLNAMIDAMIDETTAPTGRSISIRRTSDLPSTVCEEQLIKELFRNLVGNAIKYCDKTRIEIQIGLEESGEVFFVQDNGVGIDEADLSRIWGAFERADHQGLNRSGTGMGMMLAKRIVDRHGGEIWLESELQKGTTVRFSLGPKRRL